MSQLDRAKKRVAQEGMWCQFAAALSHGRSAERTKRTQHYRKGRKRNLSRARRRLDKAIVEARTP